MKLWAVGQDAGVMLTALKPIKAKVGKTDKEDWYIRPGEPIGIRYLCYSGFYTLSGLTKEQLTNPVRVNLKAEVMPNNQVITTPVSPTNEFDAVNAAIDAVEADIVTIEGNITTLNSDITGIESDISTLEDRVTQVETDQSAFDAGLIAATATANNASSTAVGAAASVGALEDTVTSIQNDLITLEGSLDDAETDIGTLQSDVSTLETDVSTLDGLVDTLRLGQTSFSALQDAITNDKTNAQPVEVKGGDLNCTSTLQIINGSGGKLVGQGGTDIAEQSSDLLKANSTLIYTGTKSTGTPHIKYERADYKISDINLYGKSATDIRNDTGTNTDICLQMTRASGSYVGVGTGKLRMYDVTMAGYNVGIEIAQSLGDGNCDENSFYNLFAYKVDTLVKVNNGQGLSNAFYNLRGSVVDTYFDYYAGGKLHVFGAFVAHPSTFLKMRNDYVGFGHNNAVYTIRDLDYDSQALGSMVVDQEPGRPYYADILVDRVHFCMNGSDVWTNAAFNLGDTTILKVTHGVNVQADMFTWNTALNASVIIVDSCKTWTNVSTAADLFDLSNSTGNCRCIVRNCHRYNTYNLLDSGVLYDQVLTGTA